MVVIFIVPASVIQSFIADDWCEISTRALVEIRLSTDYILLSNPMSVRCKRQTSYQSTPLTHSLSQFYWRHCKSDLNEVQTWRLLSFYPFPV